MVTRLDVFARVASCTNCELHLQCNGPVPFRGDRADIAIIGEAPGATEDTAGRPFIGPSGELVEELFAEVGLPPTDKLGVLNAVSCFPHGAPTWEQLAACAHNKDSQLAWIDPTWVLLLGKVALKSVRPDLDIKHGRGRPFELDGRVYFAAYHPSAALRNGNFRQSLKADLERFQEMIIAGRDLWMAFIPAACAACANDAEWYEEAGLGWCRRHLPEHLVPAYEARQALLAAELDRARRASVAQRDAAVAAVAANADPDWMTLAWDTLVKYLHTHPEFFVDDWWADTGLPEPREARALGPVVMRAARKGLMEKSGNFRKSIRSNMTEKPVWRSLVFRP
jgi:uracil-DNA glycosylase family 4